MLFTYLDHSYIFYDRIRGSGHMLYSHEALLNALLTENNKYKMYVYFIRSTVDTNQFDDYDRQTTLIFIFMVVKNTMNSI